MMRFIDPFGEIDRMMAPFGGKWRSGAMPMDAFESDGVFTLRFDLPGVNPDDVALTVERNILTVTVDGPHEDTEGVTWLLRERPTGTYRREVRLGNKLDTNKVSASHDNGVLTVTIPMREDAQPHRVAIEAKSPDRLMAGVS